MPLGLSDDDFERLLRSVLANEEFTLLDASPQTLRRRLETRLPGIDQRTQDKQAEYAQLVESSEQARKVFVDHGYGPARVVPAGYLIFAVLAIIGFFVIQVMLDSRSNRSPWVPNPTWWMLIVPLVLLGIVVYFIQRARRRRWEKDESELRRRYVDLSVKEGQVGAELQQLVYSAMVDELRSLTNKLKMQDWREDDISVSGSRLVESQPSDYLKVESEGLIADFIIGRETGALGIAGPRGVGKSTLLQHLVREPPRAEDALSSASAAKRQQLSRARDEDVPLTCFVPAPVQYDFREFLLHLYATLCRQLISPNEQDGPGASLRFLRRRTLLASAGALGLASVLLAMFSVQVLPHQSRRTTLALGACFVFVAVALPWIAGPATSLPSWLTQLVNPLRYALLLSGAFYCAVALLRSQVQSADHLRAAAIGCATASIFLLLELLKERKRLQRSRVPMPRSAFPRTRNEQVVAEAARRLDSIQFQQTVATTFGTLLKGPLGPLGWARKLSAPAHAR